MNRFKNYLKVFFSFFSLFFLNGVIAQTWPSTAWSSAINLTAIMNPNGTQDLSGLHFNPINNQLYVVQDSGTLRVLQFDFLSNTFTQVAVINIKGGPEGVTQVDFNTNEFYTIDEDNYEIRRFTHTANFSSVILYKKWNLLVSPSIMTDTGNTGPEGIVFIPDFYLSSIGFISQVTGQKYTSKKGLGGLFFVASQNAGYVWVYDINPDVSNDFAFIGKYKTNQSESCDLSFDRSTGLLYILHNKSGNNKLEVTNLSTQITNGGNFKFIVTNEYNIPNTNDTNSNIEGFALMPKCPDSEVLNAWLCRDVENNESVTIQKDALRMFTPFLSEGICSELSNSNFEFQNALKVYPNPTNSVISITGNNIRNATIRVYSCIGQLLDMLEIGNNTMINLEVSKFSHGIYHIEISKNGVITRTKFLKL